MRGQFVRGLRRVHRSWSPIMTASIPPSPFENLPEGQVTFSQTAAILGIKKSKLESLVKQGTFPTVIPGEYHLPRRLLLDEVLQFRYLARISTAG